MDSLDDFSPTDMISFNSIQVIKLKEYGLMKAPGEELSRAQEALPENSLDI